MSGIFGYASSQDCRDSLIYAMELMHYRGGDSVGFAIGGDALLFAMDVDSMQGYGNDVLLALAECSDYYRRAEYTPSCSKRFAVAMDGRIDNFDSLKGMFDGQYNACCDEELLLSMLSASDCGDMVELIRRVDSMIEGNPSYCIIASGDNCFYCKKGIAPLFIGVSRIGVFASSEINAMIGCADKYIMLRDGEIARFSKDKLVVYDKKGKRVKHNFVAMPIEHYPVSDYSAMDDVYYCPLAVKYAYKPYINSGKIAFDSLKISRHSLDRIDRIIIYGSGSSYNAAKASEYNLLTFTDVDVVACSSAELVGLPLIIDKNTLAIAVSHSGESYDTICATKRCLDNGARTIAICSNKYSYLAHIVPCVIGTGCDMCDGVSLRSFLASYTAVAMLCVYLGSRIGVVSDLYHSVFVRMIESLSGKVASSIKSLPQLEKSAGIIGAANRVVATGYLGDYAIAMEGAEKLRLIADIDAVPCPIDMVHNFADSDTTVVAIISDKNYCSIVMPYLQRLRLQGVEIVIYTAVNIEEELSDFDNIVSVNDSVSMLNPVPIASSLYKTAIMAVDSSSNAKAV